MLILGQVRLSNSQESLGIVPRSDSEGLEPPASPRKNNPPQWMQLCEVAIPMVPSFL